MSIPTEYQIVLGPSKAVADRFALDHLHGFSVTGTFSDKLNGLRAKSFTFIVPENADHELQRVIDKAAVEHRHRLREGVVFNYVTV